MLTDATYRELLDSAPDGMIVVGPDGRIVVANARMEELFGYRRDELIGQTPEVLVPDASKAAHVAYREGYERNPHTRPMGSGLALSGRRKDGSSFPVEISLSPRETPDGTLILAAVRDVTERVRLEEERRALHDAARSQNERDRIAMDLHDGIIQSIFGVGLGLEIAAEEARGTEAEALIERSIERLNEVIRDIRGYIFELRPMSYAHDLADSLKHLAGSFRASSPIAIELDVAPDLPATDDALGVAIFQITQEALANVRKHSQARRVRVAVAQTHGDLTMTVEDDGIGFDAAAERDEEHRGLRNLFERADSIGGRISIESEAGRGTVVSLAVPLNGAGGPEPHDGSAVAKEETWQRSV